MLAATDPPMPSLVGGMSRISSFAVHSVYNASPSTGKAIHHVDRSGSGLEGTLGGLVAQHGSGLPIISARVAEKTNSVYTTYSQPPKGSYRSFDNPRSRSNKTGGAGDFAIVDSDYYGGDGQLDNVSVGDDQGCQTLPGGLVIGNVYDNRTSRPLVGAQVVNDSGESVVTAATPLDNAVAAGFLPPPRG
jgi:hypothetical protein